MKLAQIVDVTLRDGAMGLGFPYDLRQSRLFLETIERAGLRHAEVGFIEGPAGAHRADVFSVNYDVGGAELAALQSAAPSIALHRMFDGGNDRLGELSSYGRADHGGLIRVTVGARPSPREANTVRRWAAAEVPLSINLKHSGMTSPTQCADMACWARDEGAGVFYIVDTAGMMRPDDVAARIDAVRAQVPDLVLGFHGHDNLGLAVANSLIADRHGCALIDASLGGVGAGGGNTPLECLILLVEPEDDAAAFLRLQPLYAAMGGHISPALGTRAFWGRIGCDSSTRARLTDVARVAVQRNVEILAWEWRFGVPLSRNGHAEVRRFQRPDGTSFVRKRALSDLDRVRAEIAFTRRAAAFDLPVPEVLSSEEDGESASYDQPYYPGLTLRDAIVIRDYDAEWAVHQVRGLVEALSRFWSAWPARAEARAFAADAWIMRPTRRLAALAEAALGVIGADDGPATMLQHLAMSPELVVGDQVVTGWHRLLEAVDACIDRLVAPGSAMVPIHGDPHFGNVLLPDTGGMVLIDGVGFLDGGDRAYDLAKVMVSLGLHDAAVEGELMPPRYRLGLSGRVEIADHGVFRNAETGAKRRAIAERVETVVLRDIWDAHLADDPGLEDRTRIATALHLISLAPTLLTERGWAAPQIFVEGLRLLDTCLRREVRLDRAAARVE